MGYANRWGQEQLAQCVYFVSSYALWREVDPLELANSIEVVIFVFIMSLLFFLLYRKRPYPPSYFVQSGFVVNSNCASHSV